MKKQLESISKSASVLVILLFPVIPVEGKSLWMDAKNNEKSMFADKRAAKVGDILGVIVSESSNMITTQRTKTDKKAGIANEINQFLFSKSASGFGTHNGELPKTDITGDNSYEGGGETTTRQTITGRITVRVIDVLPNKNLVIEGVRSVSISGETHFMALRGIVRPTDISTQNTILSSNIADTTLKIVSEGTLTDTQKKGWLTRINDKVNPF